MATKHFLNWVEGKAHALREKCSLSVFASLDPFLLAEKMSVAVLDPTQIPELESYMPQLLGTDPSAWSAGTIHPENGQPLVILNPTHCITRKRATLMEELSHVFLKHPPSQLRIDGSTSQRTYKKTYETQAYWVGTAALLPRHVLKGARTRQMTREALAEQCGVSLDLVRFREKVVGLHL